MGDISPINKPLIRDLQQIGLLSADATTPRLIGALRCKTEAFTGGSNTTTKVLASAPVSVLSAVAFPTDGSNLGTDYVKALNLTTNFTLSSTTLTYVGNSASGKLVVISYLY